jgi:hypothetical protein
VWTYEFDLSEVQNVHVFASKDSKSAAFQPNGFFILFWLSLSAYAAGTCDMSKPCELTQLSISRTET